MNLPPQGFSTYNVGTISAYGVKLLINDYNSGSTTFSGVINLGSNDSAPIIYLLASNAPTSSLEVNIYLGAGVSGFDSKS